jgi:hypothetical protein
MTRLRVSSRTVRAAMVFTTVLLLAVLVALWLLGDVRWLTKLVLTLVSFASLALVVWNPAAVIVAHCPLIAVIGTATFGIDWLNQRIR